MYPIRKNDIVSISDSIIGKVVDVITSKTIKVFKVKKYCDNEIIYVEANMVLLKKQSGRNFLLTFFGEIVVFLWHIIKVFINPK